LDLFERWLEFGRFVDEGAKYRFDRASLGLTWLRSGFGVLDVVYGWNDFVSKMDGVESFPAVG
jgi:hypothetical protein